MARAEHRSTLRRPAPIAFLATLRQFVAPDLARDTSADGPEPADGPPVSGGAYLVEGLSGDVTARELPQPERDELYPKVVAAAPAFGEYQSKTSRVIPLFELQRA